MLDEIEKVIFNTEGVENEELEYRYQAIQKVIAKIEDRDEKASFARLNIKNKWAKIKTQVESSLASISGDGGVSGVSGEGGTTLKFNINS